MNTFLYKLASTCIPSSQKRKAFRTKYLKDSTYAYQHKGYGKIYPPLYNLNSNLPNEDYCLYNEFGEKLETFFIRDFHYAHSPHCRSRYFHFDRYNLGLDTHFYTHEAMLETMGKPIRKYGAFLESEAIVPDSYEIFEKNKGLEKEFEAIFTYSEKILDSVENAKFVPFCAQLWNKNLNVEDLYTRKLKNISILSSDKRMCELHEFRYKLAHFCKKFALADTFGTFDGGNYVSSLENIYEDYRFTLCIENDISSYFFTERLTSALHAQTIPIYLGATKIDKFFNPDGIIKLSMDDDIEKILKQCTKEEYERRLPAVLENYELSKKYSNVWDMMYEDYFK